LHNNHVKRSEVTDYFFRGRGGSIMSLNPVVIAVIVVVVVVAIGIFAYMKRK
jgi:subtilase family serine protease